VIFIYFQFEKKKDFMQLYAYKKRKQKIGYRIQHTRKRYNKIKEVDTKLYSRRKDEKNSQKKTKGE
jgi:hypothetical protein